MSSRSNAIHNHVSQRLSSAKAQLLDSVSLQDDLALAHWCNRDDFTSYQRPEHHTLSIYLAGGYQTRRVYPEQSVAGGAPGKLCLMPAGHESYWDVQGELDFFHLYFSDADLQSCVEQVWDKDGSQLHLDEQLFADDAALYQLIQHWVMPLDWHLAPDRVGLQQASQLMLTHLLKHYSSNRLLDLEIKGALSQQHFQLCQDYMQANLASAISLADLAQLCHLSEYHFARLFKRRAGLSPHQYLSKLRLEQAKLLLAQPHSVLAEVALACGYSSQAHFSARFKQALGLSPSHYRRSISN